MFRGLKGLGGTWAEMIKRKSSVRAWKKTLWIVDGFVDHKKIHMEAVCVSHSAAGSTTTKHLA